MQHSRASLLVRGGTVVTMDPGGTVAPLDVAVGQDGRIQAILPPGSLVQADQVVDASGGYVVPGLVQAHVHLCQTLFRGLCEDRLLLAWLRERTWPLEAAHTAESLYASARLGIAELLLGGTTAILDMGTVHHHDAVFAAAEESGIRYTGGKAMMDGGEGVPARLLESSDGSLAESDRLAVRWHGAAGGRLRYAYCPRFALTCSEDLMRAVGNRLRGTDLRAHTHASEQRPETALVQATFGGRTNIDLLIDCGLGGTQTALAHGVWPEGREMQHLARSGGHVVHCPSCNMKLGSGIAPVREYLEAGVNVALGADGAASNNRLDGWEELRLAALLAQLRDGPTALSARTVFEMATLGGARALGLESEIGSLEVGKRADLVVLDVGAPHMAPAADIDPYTLLVYSTRASDVRTVLVNGKVVVEAGVLRSLPLATVVSEAEAQRSALVRRAFGRVAAEVRA